MGEEHPSMVRLWCMALMARMAICRLAKVTKAQPEDERQLLEIIDL